MSSCTTAQLRARLQAVDEALSSPLSQSHGARDLLLRWRRELLLQLADQCPPDRRN